MRALAPAALALALLAAPALAQPTPPAAAPAEAAPGAPVRDAESLATELCGVYRAQVTQAEQMLRQIATTLNATGRSESAAQVATRAAQMDHFAGRFSALVEATTPLNCYPPETLEQARNIAAQYGAFAAQARDFAMRPAEPAQPQISPTVQRRRDLRRQQQLEQELQQSLLP